MVHAAETEVLINGRASAEGTRRYRKRFAKDLSDSFYRVIADDTLVSALGLGTYLGECDDSDDDRYVTTIGLALQKGVNIVDTAINYRCQRSERAIGRALRESISKGKVR